MTNEPDMPAMPPACSGRTWTLMDILNVGHSEQGSIPRDPLPMLD
jgi:hypothetical protein